MASVQRDRLDARDAEVAIAGALQELLSGSAEARMFYPANRKVRRPRPLIALQSRCRSGGFDLPRERSESRTFESCPQDSRAVHIRKCSRAAGSHFEGRRRIGDTLESLRHRTELLRLDCRAQELERHVQIGAARPRDTVARGAKLFDKRGERLLDLIAHAHRNERANPWRERGSKIYLSSSHSTSGRRSLPKNITPSTKIEGEPNPPRSINSSVLARSLALYSGALIFSKYSFSSRPT